MLGDYSYHLMDREPPFTLQVKVVESPTILITSLLAVWADSIVAPISLNFKV